MLVSDNAATATNRSSVFVSLASDEHRRFAEHYGAMVVEFTVDLVEKWITVPSVEMTFYTLEEFNGFCLERVRWLNSRPFSGCSGQCSTFVLHMPSAHAAMDSSGSRECFFSWAHRMDAENDAVVDGLINSRPVVEQTFVPARSIFGLPKSYSPLLLERACAAPTLTGGGG